MNKEEAKKEIEKLVARFREHREEYHLPEYNETKTRQDFVNQFFKALGWDVDNSGDAAEAYREVIHEDKVKVNGKMKAPDYGFRLPGSDKRLFCVEAKKPAILLKMNREASFQLRRYGLSAQTPVSILTNFEEFVVYDCSRKPDFNDGANVARLKYINFEQYSYEFDFIYDTFSRDAVIRGRFDKFVKSDTYKKGAQVLDKYFVETLNEWRTQIATSIARNNLNLNEDDINYVVQLTIDRLIFLRFCEDRGVEPYGQMKTAIASGDSFKNLLSIFQLADDKYNSGLFDFKKDTISPALKIDNKILKNIAEDLYYPKSSYDFRIMPVEILGNAYEQFLGKVIRITKGHHAKIDDKPEVRKAGGVYYTPQYIVNYIVANTLGKLVEGKSPKEIENIKIVDPACGSGSFLIGAFQFLLNYHTQWYFDKGLSGKKTKDNPLSPDGKLTGAEKKKILLNNIYGVDIDTNAVEVTKLSLLLKCMEGETEASIKQQLSVFHERVLPDLDNNIKSGNSLIDEGIYDSELELDYEKKIKPFTWSKAFPEVFKPRKSISTNDLKQHINLIRSIEKNAGKLIKKYQQEVNEPFTPYGASVGFDIVIGNPPYGALFSQEEKDYLVKVFTNQNYQMESYLIFLEQSVKNILREEGLFGMIIPNPWLTNLLQKSLRKFIFENSIVEEIVHFKNPVFKQVTVDTEIILIKKEKPKENHIKITVVEKDKDLLADTHNYLFPEQKEWIETNGDSVNIFLSPDDKKLLNKILKATQPLEKYFSINVGIKPYQVGKGKPKQNRSNVENRIFDSVKKSDKYYRQVLRGSDIHRFTTIESEPHFLKYGEWLAEPRYSANFDAPEKIFIRQTGDSLIATIDKKQMLCLNNLHVLVPNNGANADLLWFLGLLNSRLLTWFYQTLNPEAGEALAEVKKSFVAQLPVKDFDMEQSSFKNIHDSIAKHVDLLLKLNAELPEAKLPDKIAQIKSRIGYSEDKINGLVYELYGLTEEEIKIVEG